MMTDRLQEARLILQAGGGGIKVLEVREGQRRAI